MNIYQNILIIGKVWPEPNSSAAGTRMMQLLHFFRSKKANITFASTANETNYQEDLSSFGIKTAAIKLNSETFDEFARDLNPTMVVFDRFTSEEQFGWRILQQCPNALRVLNTEDLHFLRDARRQALEDGRTLDVKNPAEMRTVNTVREISAIYRSDLTLLVSEFEIDLLRNEFQLPAHLLYYLPVLAGPAPVTIPEFEARKDFVFIGNFLHKPNLDAVSYLKEAIWPLIRSQMPEAIVNVYGAYPGQKVLALHDPARGFNVHGRAVDAFEVNLNARVSLAPLRFGAGMKGKLLEAMLCGTPTVTTSIGAESMQQDNLWNGEIADSEASFANAAVALATNREKWTEAQARGFLLVDKRYQAALHLPNFDQALQNLGNYLDAHRAKDFTSHLMQQEFMISARYLSMWIMEKERSKRDAQSADQSS